MALLCGCAGAPAETTLPSTPASTAAEPALAPTPVPSTAQPDPEYPASLSTAVHQLLREELGFGGVIITDDLAMDTIAGVYGEAAVLAVLAGNDMLCTSGYEVQFQAIMDAVNNGRIAPGQIWESVIRILRWKMALGIL